MQTEIEYTQAIASAPRLVEALNGMGAKGWEFILHFNVNDPTQGELLLLIFKREKSRIQLPAGMK